MKYHLLTLSLTAAFCTYVGFSFQGVIDAPSIASASELSSAVSSAMYCCTQDNFCRHTTDGVTGSDTTSSPCLTPGYYGSDARCGGQCAVPLRKYVCCIRASDLKGVCLNSAPGVPWNEQCLGQEYTSGYPWSQYSTATECQAKCENVYHTEIPTTPNP